MKCGKCNIRMEKTGEEIIHNKELEVFKCPKCGEIIKLEVT